jgi:hypothetical protein
VFNFVFESKNTKEDSIREMKELFHDKTEEIMDLLWSLTEKIYNLNTVDKSSSLNNSDLLEEIYKDKNENQPRKFPSQIVNPNAETRGNFNKHPFNSAIEKVKDDKKRERERDFDRDRNYNNNNFRNRDNRNYQNQYRRHDDYRGYNNNRDKNYEGDDRRTNRKIEIRTMRVGDKQVVIKKKERSRSRSRDNDKKDRPKDEKEIITEEEQQYEEVPREYPGEQHQHYERNYYPGYQNQRGYYNVRRFSRGGGRFPTRYMQPRYMEPRR